MPTIPTGKLERELRRLYMRWVHQLPKHERDLHNYVAKFQRQSMDLIERMGGDVARLGALGDFPAPKRLDLSLHVGTIYSDMELAAISAQIGTGLNPKTTARALVRAGVDKSYRRLERLARTETVRAYWHNAWGSVADLPALVMVWGAERGPRTCEWCLERDGLVIDSDQVRDHPNGRCTPIPTLRSQVEYRGSIDSSGQIYHDPAWSKEVSVPDSDSSLAEAYEDPIDAFDISHLPSKVREWGSSNLPTSKGMSAAEKRALTKYTGPEYARINTALRAGGNLPKAVQNTVNHLDSALDKTSLKQAVRVTRSLDLDAFPGLSDLKKLQGATIQDAAYMSTTVKGNGVRKVLIDLEVPKGSRGVWVDNISENPGEYELLLPRNTSIKIERVQKGERQWKLIAKVVPNEM